MKTWTLVALLSAGIAIGTSNAEKVARPDVAVPEAPKPEGPKLVPALGWDVSKQGAYPTCIASDVGGAIWVGTEGSGVWRFDPADKSWKQFTTKDGLGDDDIYAVAVDKLNRVWIGHLNHGVSVWNGEKWRNYGVVDGPLGSRVFAIATCPTDGDVWMATDCGLARYSIEAGQWDYFTRASGLPSNQIQSLAFSANGDLSVGTQCDGIAVATAEGKYRKWTRAAGPLVPPVTPFGQGLPTNLINSISTLRLRGREYLVAGTTSGMCISTRWPDWTHTRGADWQSNNAGEPAAQFQRRAELLQEDWVSDIRSMQDGLKTWVAYRRKGLEIRSLAGSRSMTRIESDPANPMMIRAIWLEGKAPPLVAVYAENTGGLKTLENAGEPAEPAADPAAEKPAEKPGGKVLEKAPLPKPAEAPGAESLEAVGKYLETFKTQLNAGQAVYAADDWCTQGDWIGRYGSSYALLCGVTGTGREFAREDGFSVSVAAGPHHKGEGGLFSYVANLKTENPRVLYDPVLGHRREAENNDGSFDTKAYPPEWAGPDLWVTVNVPPGVHALSFYFHNNDAQKGAERKFRDYDVQLVPWSEKAEEVNVADPLARCRVTDFAGGVYKTFFVSGPAKFVAKVGRNHSHVTKLQGVFLDRMTGERKAQQPLPGFAKAGYRAPVVDTAKLVEANPALSPALELWADLGGALNKAGAVGWQMPMHIVAYRSAVAAKAPPELLTAWRWELSLWTAEDRQAFQEGVAKAHAQYREENGAE